MRAPALKLFSRQALALLMALSVGIGRAEVLPTQGHIDERIRTAVYSADQVFRLYGYVGFHLDLEFEADETFASLSGGDLDGLTYSAHANVLTLKPKVAATEMNLAVTTSKRRYYFEYSVSARRPSASSDPNVRRWNPLGFKVVDFKPEPEVETPTAPASPATPSTGGGG